MTRTTLFRTTLAASAVFGAVMIAGCTMDVYSSEPRPVVYEDAPAPR